MQVPVMRIFVLAKCPKTKYSKTLVLLDKYFYFGQFLIFENVLRTWDKILRDSLS